MRRLVAGAAVGLAVAGSVTVLTTAASAAAPRLTGHLDSVTTVSMGEILVTGWAADTTHLNAPVGMAVYIDGAGHGFTSAIPRPDVQRTFDAPQSQFGFSAPLLIAGGSHQVCVYALASDGRTNHLLACRTITFPVNPIAHIDKIEADCFTLDTSNPHYRVTGWVFDPDARGGPGSIAIYIDERQVGGLPNLHIHSNYVTSLARPDVAKVYGLTNNKVGFQIDVSGYLMYQFRIYSLNSKGPGVNLYLITQPETSSTSNAVPCI